MKEKRSQRRRKKETQSSKETVQIFWNNVSQMSLSLPWQVLQFRQEAALFRLKPLRGFIKGFLHIWTCRVILEVNTLCLESLLGDEWQLRHKMNVSERERARKREWQGRERERDWDHEESSEVTAVSECSSLSLYGRQQVLCHTLYTSLSMWHESQKCVCVCTCVWDWDKDSVSINQDHKHGTFR